MTVAAYCLFFALCSTVVNIIFTCPYIPNVNIQSTPLKWAVRKGGGLTCHATDHFLGIQMVRPSHLLSLFTLLLVSTWSCLTLSSSSLRLESYLGTKTIKRVSKKNIGQTGPEKLHIFSQSFFFVISVAVVELSSLMLFHIAHQAAQHQLG